MFKNYLVTALRNLLRNRLYTSINVVGLTIGLSSCLFIFLYLHNELGYDKYYNHKHNIYRLVRTATNEAGKRLIGITSAPFAEAMLTDYPGIVNQTLRVEKSTGLISFQDRAFLEDKLFVVDSNFYSLLNFHLVKGDPATVLRGGKKAVISSALAKKYFGDEDPIGKIIQLDNNELFEITGEFDKSKFDSHLDFDLTISIDIYKNRRFFKDWWSNSFSTYIVLEEGKVENDLEPHLQDFMNKYFGEDFKRTGRPMGLVMEPLQDVYFNNQTQFDNVKHGDLQAIYIFSAVTILVFLIAIVNFINLSSATASRRAIEIGIRKTNGANRTSLMLQFLIETSLVTLVAVLLSLLILEVGVPYFSNFIGKSLSVPLSNIQLIITAVALVIICSALAGFYPSLVLSSFKPAVVLKKKVTPGKGLLMRKFLVVFQFGISIFLIIATLVTWTQLEFIGQKKLGFNKENVLIIRLDNRGIRTNADVFKERLMAMAGIESVAIMSGEPGGFYDNYSFEVEGFEDQQSMRTVFSDFEYLNLFDLEIIEGRNFSRDYPTDQAGALIINEEAAAFLGWSAREAIGKEIRNNFRDDTARRVVGVVKNFHFRSLKEQIEPLVISMNRDSRVAAVKIHSANLEQTIRRINQEWDKYVNRYPMSYFFLDDSLDRLYFNEKKQANLFQIFGLISISIACLGLFGLSTLTTERRMKEIGVRKVLGADFSTILLLLGKNFVYLVLVASLIVLPFGWIAMEKWLNNFEYRVSLHPWYFLAAAGIALLIAALTVTYHSMKAAMANPVETLRYE